MTTLSNTTYDTPTELLSETDEFLISVSLLLPPEEPPAPPGVRIPATVSTEGELRTAISANNSPINVAANFTISSVINISGNRDIVIQSLAPNTNTISRAGNFSSTYMFLVNTGSSLTLSNIALNGMDYDSYSIVANLGTLTVEDGTLIYNSAFSGVINQGTMYVTGGIFENNRNTGGGAIFSSKNGILNISGGIFRNNEATLFGGAIYSNNATVNISGGEFTGNKAGRNGGGLGLVNLTTGNIYGTANIHYNETEEAGGGVTIQNSNVSIYGDVQIANNRTVDYGGGIYSHTTTGFLSNIAIYDRVNITQNQAGSGGGIFAFFLNEIQIYGSVSITNNLATQVDGNGGGITLLDQAQATIGENVLVQYNIAFLSGGGIFLFDATLQLSGQANISRNMSPQGSGVADFGLLQLQDSVLIEKVYLDDPRFLLELTGPLTSAYIAFELSDYFMDKDLIVVAQGSSSYPLPTAVDASYFIPPSSGYKSIVYNDTQIAFIRQNEITIQFDPNTKNCVTNMPGEIVSLPGLITFPTTIPQRCGYIFIGWGTLPNGGTIYQPGQTVDLESDTVFYAQWTASPFSPHCYYRYCYCCCR